MEIVIDMMDSGETLAGLHTDFGRNSSDAASVLEDYLELSIEDAGESAEEN